MFGNILNTPDCVNCREFSKNRSFCFNCFSFICSDCVKNKHIDKQHDVLSFQINESQWSSEKYILELFEDKTFGKEVFYEIHRTIDTLFLSDGDSDSSERYSPCNTSRNGSNLDRMSESQKKLRTLLTKIQVIENNLSDCDGANFEHIANEYLRSGDDYSDFEQWFREKYLAGYALSIVNLVLDQEGHNLTTKQFSDKYSELVKSQNDDIIKHLPHSLINQVDLSKGLILLKDINASNIVPSDMMNKEIDKDSLWTVIIQDGEYTEYQKRMIMAELVLSSVDKLDFLCLLIRDPSCGPYLKEGIHDGSVSLGDFRQALDQMTIVEAMTIVCKECAICCALFSSSQMMSLLICEHEACKSCFREWLYETIQQKFPRKWGCPVCPDEKFENIERNLYITNLRMFLNAENSNEKSKKILSIFDSKLLNEQLMGSKFFHWCCSDLCENGFEAEGIVGKAQCPSCGKSMCLDCNRAWNEKHDNLTCQEYELLMLKDDPDLGNILKDIGIECPNCTMRYAVAAGGCLHFECKACPSKFCGCCYNFFTDNCDAERCGMKKAFHAHHPRNCLYYLRDKTPAELEKMLGSSDYPKLKDKPDQNCPFTLTDKVTMKDYSCGKAVFDTSGLCDEHYREYLVQFINRLNIDPSDYADRDDLNLTLFQALRPKLEKMTDESEDAFVARLKKEVKTCPFYTPKGVKNELVQAPLA